MPFRPTPAARAGKAAHAGPILSPHARHATPCAEDRQGLKAEEEEGEKEEEQENGDYRFMATVGQI